MHKIGGLLSQAGADLLLPQNGPFSPVPQPRAFLKNPNFSFFVFVKDSLQGPPTANSQQPPTANRQPPTANNH
jgi:hypothetical protein